jgi:hypothetical protein
MPLALGILAVTFGAAVALGLLVHRLEERSGRIDNRDRRLVGDGMTGALSFLGGSAAFLLGVLMLTSVDHFNGTAASATAEALNYSAAFDGTAALRPADTDKLQRDLVCLMRSVATTSWAATEEGDLTGSENTHAWQARALRDADAVVPETYVQDGLSTVHSELREAAKAGQERLLASEANLPTALWLLVYLSLFVLIFSLTLLLRPYPTLAVATLAAIMVLSTAMVWVLTAFSGPFSKGDGVYISPRALESVMLRLQSSYPGKAWEPCEDSAQR